MAYGRKNGKRSKSRSTSKRNVSLRSARSGNRGKEPRKYFRGGRVM